MLLKEIVAGVDRREAPKLLQWIQKVGCRCLIGPFNNSMSTGCYLGCYKMSTLLLLLGLLQNVNFALVAWAVTKCQLCSCCLGCHKMSTLPSSGRKNQRSTEGQAAAAAAAVAAAKQAEKLIGDELNRKQQAHTKKRYVIFCVHLNNTLFCVLI